MEIPHTMTREAEYRHDYFLTAGESNAEGQLPLSLLAERVIEASTEHANALGIGYDALIREGMGWVLSRMSIEISRYPKINEHYSLVTWIESYNRRFSERNCMITGDNGEVLGYVRTIWSAMSFKTRTFADLTDFEREAFPIGTRECPISKIPRIAPITDVYSERSYTFKYCDLDFNRHVNTVRYIQLLLNSWPQKHFDKYIAGRFDLLFHSECHYDETVAVRLSRRDDSGRQYCEIIGADNTRAISAGFTWTEIN